MSRNPRGLDGVRQCLFLHTEVSAPHQGLGILDRSKHSKFRKDVVGAHCQAGTIEQLAASRCVLHIACALACLPKCAPIQHMQDHVFADEQKVALDLRVASVRSVHSAHVVRARLGPPSLAKPACRLSYTVYLTVSIAAANAPPSEDRWSQGGQSPWTSSKRFDATKWSSPNEVCPIRRVFWTSARTFPGAPILENWIGSSVAQAAQGFSWKFIVRRLGFSRLALARAVGSVPKPSSIGQRASATGGGDLGSRGSFRCVRDPFGFPP